MILLERAFPWREEAAAIEKDIGGASSGGKSRASGRAARA